MSSKQKPKVILPAWPDRRPAENDTVVVNQQDFLAIVKERDHLREQVTTLQTTLTSMEFSRRDLEAQRFEYEQRLKKIFGHVGDLAPKWV